MRTLIRTLACAAIVLVFSVGCQNSRRVHGVPVSGFLGDYSQLEKGRGGQARLVYINPESDFSDYTSVIVDPVTTAGTDDPDDSLERHAKYFDAAIREEIARAFRVVDTPEPGALRIRVALTDATESRLVIECEVLDALSGTRLVAAVADRSPQAIAGEDVTAADVLPRALTRWAELIRKRLATFRDFDAAEKQSEGSP